MRKFTRYNEITNLSYRENKLVLIDPLNMNRERKRERERNERNFRMK